MKRFVLSITPVLALTLVCVPAYADLVTFNSFTPLNTQFIGPVSDGGLTFTGSPYLGVFSVGGNYNGTPGLIDSCNGITTITRTGGGAFDLNSFQMTLSFYNSDPTADVTLTAYFFGGGSASQNITLGQGLQTYDLNLADVVSVDVSHLGDSFWLMDNVQYDAVPEPASLLLLGTGLVGLARWRRRRS